MPSPQDYFDREYFELHAGKVPYLDYLIGLLDRFGVDGGRVLDVGCGYGFLLGRLSREGLEPVGLELSPHAGSKAVEHSGCPVVVASAENDLPLTSNVFDAVTLFDVVEHVRDVDRSLGELYRVLRPGGRLFMITLNRHSAARPLLGRSWSWYKDPTHVHMFSPADLRRLALEEGFEVVGETTFFNFCSVGESTPWLKVFRRIRRVIEMPACGDSFLLVVRKPLSG